MISTYNYLVQLGWLRVINLFNRKPKSQRRVKLDIINAIELKPEANYILVVNGKDIKRPEIESMLKELRSRVSEMS